MKVAIISDTHGYLDAQIKKHLASCDEIWHAGDLGGSGLVEELEAIRPTRGVYGNIDGDEVRKAWPEWLEWNCEGLKIVMLHIGGRPPRYARDVLPALKRKRPDVFICGHSHILCVKRDPVNGWMYINPGAAGRHGFHKVRTLLLLEVEGGALKDLKVVELGSRSAKA